LVPAGGRAGPFAGPALDKRDARRMAQTRRAAMLAGEKHGLAAALSHRLLAAMPIAPGEIVAGYAAIRDEAELWPLLSRLHEGGAVCCLPVMQGPGLPLLFRRWQPGDALQPAAFGVPEPLPDAPILRPAIVLAPLLAFDRAGGRLGYGAGFYDRTLAGLRRDGTVIAVGLAHSGQELPAVPTDDHDQPLDWVITEREAIRCTGPAAAARPDEARPCA
jgi:5-formyltetrahydrofolate cyclo-ligase